MSDPPLEPLRSGDPRRIGGYYLTGRLGEGGMGEVFLGRTRAGRLVAVKLIRPEYARQAEFRERFAREIAAASQVGGFRAVHVIDADPHAGRPWMVTAYVAGESLQTRVDTDGALEVRDAARVAAQIAEGLAAIHDCGLVHRDLKPSNVLLAEDGVRIIDFGISRAVEASTLTGTGVILGTYQYMSPEQLREAPVTSASDVFSFGSVLAFTATGAPPFQGRTLPGLIYEIMTGTPDLGNVPRPLRSLASECLARDAPRRPSLDAIITRCAAIADLPGHGTAQVPHDTAPPRVTTASGAGPVTVTSAAAPVAAQAAPPQAAPPQAAPEPRVAAPEALALRAKRGVPRRLVLAGGLAAAGAGAALWAELPGNGPGHAQAAGRTSAGTRLQPSPGGLARRQSAGPAPRPARAALVGGPSRALTGFGNGSAVLSPDGHMIAVTPRSATPGPESSGAGAVQLRAATDLGVTNSTTVPWYPLYTVFSPDGARLFGTGIDAAERGSLILLNSPGLTRAKTTRVPGDGRGLMAAAFSPDGRRVLAVNNAMWLLDAFTLNVTRSGVNPADGPNPHYSPDGTVIAVGGSSPYAEDKAIGQSAVLVDATNLTARSTVTFSGTAGCTLAFSPDSKTLAAVSFSTSGDAVASILSVPSLRVARETALPAPSTQSLVAAGLAGFALDGKLLIGYIATGDVWIWAMDVATMKTVATAYIGFGGAAPSVTMSLDSSGRTLFVTYSDDRSQESVGRIWHIMPR